MEQKIMDDFFRPGTEVKVRELSPLVLAYIGDAVFEILVRTLIIKECPVNKLHRTAKGYVSAVSQAKMFKVLEDKLTEEGFEVMKRGRNAKSATSAKNASIVDYRHATGVEALFGYLYLKGENQRLYELFKICADSVTKEN